MQDFSFTTKTKECKNGGKHLLENKCLDLFNYFMLSWGYKHKNILSQFFLDFKYYRSCRYEHKYVTFKLGLCYMSRHVSRLQTSRSLS